MEQLQRIGWRDRALLITACVAGFAAVFLVVRDAVAEEDKTVLVEAALAPAEANAASEMSALKRRVEALEARVKELEASRTKIITGAVGTVPVPPGVGPSVPDNWVEQDFNGIKFYLVPTEQGQERAVTAPATQPTQP